MGVSDRPPPLTPVDRIIRRYHGSTTAIQATPEQLQASKQFPIPSLPEKIKQLQKQNSSLNHEVAYYQQIEQAWNEFQDVVTQVSDKLQRALSKLDKIQKQAKTEATPEQL